MNKGRTKEPLYCGDCGKKPKRIHKRSYSEQCQELIGAKFSIADFHKELARREKENKWLWTNCNWDTNADSSAKDRMVLKIIEELIEDLEYQFSSYADSDWERGHKLRTQIRTLKEYFK